MKPSNGPSRPGTPRSRAEQRALITLSLVPGVGTGRIRSLVSAFGSALESLHASPASLAAVPGIGMGTARRIGSFEDEAAVDRQIAQAERVGAEMITLWDDRYPFLLRQIYDPPAFLWSRGRMPAADQPERAVAVVGTRRATAYGRRAAHDLAYSLARLGFTIVSGLAYGIDAEAHAAALEAGGRTVAVLGSGVDRIYPARHRRMAGEILASGAILSEYPLGAKPEAPNFPRRNRVISGLSLGTLIVEAYEEGGALITARLALEQNREVFAVPGSIYSGSSAGANRLIQRSEAKLVHSVEDLLEELGISADPAVTNERPPNPESLTPEERSLLEALTSEPTHIDALCAAAGLDPATALVHLLSLEFRGVVRQLAGKQFYLAYAAVS